jgi:glycosyltransferase involved in cell wall biosynthesis
LKIALVMPTLEFGGVEQIMLRMAGSLLQKGVSVDLVVADASGPMSHQIPIGAQLTDLKARRVSRSLPNLIKYLRQARPDAIISAKDYQNIVLLWAVKLAHIPAKVIVTTRIDVSVDWRNSRGWKWWFIPLLVKYCYAWADQVIAVSNGAAESLAKATGIPRRNIKTIYNAVVTQRLLELAEEPVDDAWFVQGDPVVLGVGRLTEQKDFGTLIRAFYLVNKVRPARLVILGDGQERAKLEAIIQELDLKKEVAMPGFVENVYKYMKKSAIVALSSKFEGLGNVLIEALVLGIPVVSTDCPSGPSEILENGRWGSMVPIGNDKAMAKAILDILDHSPFAKEALIRRGMEFSADRAAEAYLQLIKEED